MPKISAEREEATRRSILRAARDVFVAKGFHEATTHDVARAAGLSVGSIYTYFASKDELIRECVLAANKAESEAVLQDIRSDGSTRTKISRAIAGWYRYTIEAPGVPAFLAEAWAAASRKPLIRDMVAQRRERIVTVAVGRPPGRRRRRRAGVRPGRRDDRPGARGAPRWRGPRGRRGRRPPSPADVERRALLLLGPTRE